ncbi:MAG TPA: uracil-DNA glycosylase family protein [Polyangiaceae bacterium]
MKIVEVSRDLSRAVERLRFDAPVAFVYNPLAYARAPHEAYLRRYGAGTREILLLGMNPGPFGMAQTGVPFGDVTMVRDFLKIEGEVAAPERVHERRPISGFACPRSEVSGTRLWGWVKGRFETPARFFDRFFVANYCPLVFLEASGRNRTPDKLPPAERQPLFAACDAALRRMVALLAPRFVIGVGGFAAERARSALSDYDGTIACVLHPSPASPAANRGWASLAEGQLSELGIRL